MTPKLEVHIAVAKVNKYATSESGDTVEVVERPRGGMSIVMADGQRSGRSAKAISNIVVRKAIALLAEGVRDGAVARATHDYLHAQRGGKVSAELNIVSIDLVTHTLVISRNSRCPVLLRHGDQITRLDQESNAVGIHRNTKPIINEFDLTAGMTVVAFTDGVWSAGSYMGQTIDLESLMLRTESELSATASTLADAILQAAVDLDHGRPRDDVTVLVVKIAAQVADAQYADNIRRLSMRIPI